MRSVDWITFLQYVVPTLAFEKIEAEYGSTSLQLEALMALVTGCAIALSWNVKEADIRRAEEYVIYALSSPLMLISSFL